AMMIGVVKEIAFDAPHLVVHLIPFRTWVGVNFHAIELQGAVPWLHYDCRPRDEPSRALAVQHFFAIRGYGEPVGSANERVRLSRLEIEFRNSYRRRLAEARYIHHFREEQCPGLPGVQVHVICMLDRHCDNSLADSIQVNDDFDRLFLLLRILPSLSFFSLVWFFTFVRVFALISAG